MAMRINQFNIRVYAIFLYSGSILLSDEYFKGRCITKFPGGGLEYGEGTLDCLRREIKEEMNLELRMLKHFYTLDFMQSSAFGADKQLLTIYYLARFKEPFTLKVSQKPFDFTTFEGGAISLRWKPLRNLMPGEMTFPAEQVVVRKLRECYGRHH